MAQIEKSCRIIIEQCMALKSNESCLIVSDHLLRYIGESLHKNCLKITKKSKLVLTSIPKTHGTEPPENIARQMLNYDVILMPTAKSLSHTRARKAASKKGARIASMPGITVDMMQRALNVDFYRIREQNKKLISMLKGRSKITIKSENKTDASFFVKGRSWISDDGIYTKKGAFGNLPAGEIFIAPLEGKTEGTLIVDASIGGIGKVDKKIKIAIKEGFAQEIKGGSAAKIFMEIIDEKNDFSSNNNFFPKNLYRNVAELGIGTNYKAIITGNVLEDEKVSGTCHVAFGNNRHFGGRVDVPFHVDVVIKKPNIFADGRLIF